MRTRIVPIVLLVLALGAPTRADEPEELPEGSPVALERSITLKDGVHHLVEAPDEGAIRIETDGVVLDLGGAMLDGQPLFGGTESPDELTGTCIVVRGAKNVVIRNGSIRGFKVAILAKDAPFLRIENVDASGNYRQRLESTPTREDASDWLWPHENDKHEWTQRYGGAFSLTGCDDAQVSGCTVNRGQNGLLLTRCARAQVYDNDFSFNSGWGIGMYRSTHCKVAHNRCDWCVRGYSHGVYYRGQDSAGILVFEQCTDNVFLHNSATHGGDGFFLYAGHETTQRTGKGGSGRNVVAFNDFRFAVANGIEATFSEGNVFYGNDVSGADHGVWAGYSRNTLIAANTIKDCMTAGISIEHGTHNRMIANEIEGGRYGIHLWWDEDKAFLEGPFGKHQDTASARNDIAGNVIEGSRVALRLWNDQASSVRGNRLGARETVLEFGPGTTLAALRGNTFQGAHGPRHPKLPSLVRNRTGAPFVLPGANVIAGRFRPIPPRRGPNRVEQGEGAPVFEEVPKPAFEKPAVPGTLDTALPADMPVGRDQMRIGEWGPFDPRHAHAYLSAADGGEATLTVLGTEAWTARLVEGNVELGTASGTGAANVAIRPRKGNVDVALGLLPFHVEVKVGTRTFDLYGRLLDAEWTVRFFEWTADPREDANAFSRLLKEKPTKVLRTRSLDFPWQGGHPEGVRADRFATRATTSFRVAAGRYRIRTTSDDGVRVYVDGKRVIDNWTHHGPTEDTALVELTEGTHAFEVVHFELTGWAWLSFAIGPAE